MARILIGLTPTLFLITMSLFKHQFYLNQVDKYLGNYQEESDPIGKQIEETEGGNQ
ncbi:hypothetical protein NO976_04364 (plasmid) [Planktothrix agardhii]|jgi:hypothetical protein|uniref:hypothetical protein n=1 Tax=Planktothrix agardhii TaxID=1160 RepID=UPI0020A7AC90|nr:hypothetical protein [Planktothrix agardhii]CAD5983719.1 hypothetical protein NO976_04364 [Planktothrix agardhii]